jgi:hypothetical protein
MLRTAQFSPVKMRRLPMPIRGKDGQSGRDGVDGLSGEDGERGRDGIDGKDGQPGAQGERGFDGLPGIDGRNGVDGATGPKGDTGETGLQGEVGPVGPPGPKGDKGDTGPRPDHQIDRKKGSVRFKRPDGTWGAWLEIKREIVDRTVKVMESGGRGAQSLQAIKDVERLNYNIQPIKTVTADYSAVGLDYTIVIDASSAAVTVTLPSSPTKGKVYNIACLNSTNTAQVDFNGNLYFDSSDNELLFKGENLKVQWTGNEWVSA